MRRVVITAILTIVTLSMLVIITRPGYSAHPSAVGVVAHSARTAPAARTVWHSDAWYITQHRRQRIADLERFTAALRFGHALELNAQAAARAQHRAHHTSSAPSTPHAGSVNWDAIARCETQGNWSMQGPRFSGGLGFANTTWSGFGGQQFASNAGQASRAQQIIVAQRVYARYGLSGWGCRRFG
jgi:Transglycosylase-like domain